MPKKQQRVSLEVIQTGTSKKKKSSRATPKGRRKGAWVDPSKLAITPARQEVLFGQTTSSTKWFMSHNKKPARARRPQSDLLR